MSRFCWHRWDKWKQTGEGFLRVEYNHLTGEKLNESEKFISNYFIRQERECSKCGKKQLRRATT